MSVPSFTNMVETTSLAILAAAVIMKFTAAKLGLLAHSTTTDVMMNALHARAVGTPAAVLSGNGLQRDLLTGAATVVFHKDVPPNPCSAHVASSIPRLCAVQHNHVNNRLIFN